MPEHVVGHVIDRLGETDELPFPVVVKLTSQCQPVGRRRECMCCSKLEPVVSRRHSEADTRERIDATDLQSGQLAADASEVSPLDPARESTQHSGFDFLNRRIREVRPDGPVINPHGIRPHMVAAEDAFTVMQSELPVVPVAGQHAFVINAAFGQRISLVRDNGYQWQRLRR